MLVFAPGLEERFFDLAYFLQLLHNGLANGAIYALTALAVVVVYRTTGHLNFAVGEMGTFGAFVVFAIASDHELPLIVAMLAAVAASAALAGTTDLVLVRRVEARSELSVLIVGLGLFLVFGSVTAAIWGVGNRAGLKPFPSGPSDQITIITGPPRFAISYRAIGVWVTLIVVLVLLQLLMNRTRFGLAYRGISSNPESSLLVGVPNPRLRTYGWALSGVIGTIAAVLVSQQSDVLNFHLMGPVLVYGFIAACIGGFDSISGAVMGGLAVGLVESMFPQLFTFIEPDLSMFAILLLLIVVLLVRPQGLWGSKRLTRA